MKPTKHECHVYFTHDARPGKKSRAYKGTFHLFEVTYYSNQPAFWFGLLDLVCEHAQVLKYLRRGVTGIRVWIELDCGLCGMARLAEGIDLDGFSTRIQVVGVTGLRLP